MNSDHRLVKCSFILNWRKFYQQKKTTAKNIQVSHLKDQATSERYKQTISEKLPEINLSEKPNDLKWKCISEALIGALETAKLKLLKKDVYFNEQIDKLSQKQKDLRLRIESENDYNTKNALKKSRNEISRSIKNIKQQEKEEKYDIIAQNINNSKNEHHIFY